MSNKTPYEIRLEVLAMAKDYFDQIQSANLLMAKDAFAKACELNNAAIEQWKSYIPVSYTTDDVMKKATEFYEFISKKA